MNFIKNLTIQAKLLLGFGLMILIISVLGLTSFYSVRSITRELHHIFSVRMPSNNLLLEIDRDLHQLLVAERSMIFTNVKSEAFETLVKNYEENLTQAHDRWLKYKEIKGLTPEEQELISAYDALYVEWNALSRQAVDGRVADTREGRTLALDLSLGEAQHKI